MGGKCAPRARARVCVCVGDDDDDDDVCMRVCVCVCVCVCVIWWRVVCKMGSKIEIYLQSNMIANEMKFK